MKTFTVNLEEEKRNCNQKTGIWSPQSNFCRVYFNLLHMCLQFTWLDGHVIDWSTFPLQIIHTNTCKLYLINLSTWTLSSKHIHIHTYTYKVCNPSLGFHFIMQSVIVRESWMDEIRTFWMLVCPMHALEMYGLFYLCMYIPDLAIST